MIEFTMIARGHVAKAMQSYSRLISGLKVVFSGRASKAQLKAVHKAVFFEGFRDWPHQLCMPGGAVAHFDADFIIDFVNSGGRQIRIDHGDMYLQFTSDEELRSWNRRR